MTIIKFTRLLVITISVVSLLLLTGSCQNPPARNSPVGFLNYSESSLRDLPLDYYRQMTHRLLLAYPNTDLSFWVVARYPLYLRVYNQGLNLTYEEIQKRLEAEYDKQSGGIDPQGKPWGKGTNHATVFQRIAKNRIKGAPLLVVGVTDGENELCPWETVEETLKELFAGGPTRLVLVGISQRVVGGRGPLTVLDLWERALEQAGATNLAVNPRAEQGYLLSSTPAVPEWALWMPKPNSRQGGENQ